MTTTASRPETVAYFTEDQQDANWDNLSPEQQDYFNHLAANDPERTGQAFFEEEAPSELQDKPELLEKYLNGDEDLGIDDRDWSHDVSDKNGGSGSADNGRFEDSSTNRARGSRNTTVEEQQAADAHSEEDVQTLLESAEEVAEVSAWAGAAEVASGFLEASLDGLLPIVGGAFVGKKVYDRFEKPADKVGFAAIGSGLTVAFLASPAGTPVVGCYVLWNVGKRGVKLWNKHIAK